MRDSARTVTLVHGTAWTAIRSFWRRVVGRRRRAERYADAVCSKCGREHWVTVKGHFFGGDAAPPSYSANEHQDQENHQHQAQQAARTVTPTTRIGPRGQDGEK